MNTVTSFCTTQHRQNEHNTLPPILLPKPFQRNGSFDNCSVNDIESNYQFLKPQISSQVTNSYIQHYNYFPKPFISNQSVNNNINSNQLMQLNKQSFSFNDSCKSNSSKLSHPFRSVKLLIDC
ncbi:hypothetical protein EWB00_008322 [Schistosoma japonicum]|uniref:SJCHGC05397 protein n=1 Tax=Schistosoma japonicum TaxID=6182 RepID=Q5D8V7_SCHJA|nr:SJCHGC05397 protein [Schistosoma japonicum]TNN06522.1 hypothetical protein EWB00_008322 [Schistosoma japonicum]